MKRTMLFALLFALLIALTGCAAATPASGVVATAEPRGGQSQIMQNPVEETPILVVDIEDSQMPLALSPEDENGNEGGSGGVSYNEELAGLGERDNLLSKHDRDLRETPTPTPANTTEPENDAPVTVTSTPAPTPAPIPTATPAPTRDTYQTDPVPDGKPNPVEPQDARLGSAMLSATLSVTCNTILDNMSRLDPNKTELVPADGVIYSTQTVYFQEGESVFNVLQRSMKAARIHMEFRNTPIYNSAYIMGINNLYEFDCGELSGWMYKVNGWFPNYGCSRYQLNDGDVIEWIYTCDLGRDIGEFWLAGGQQ